MVRECYQIESKKREELLRKSEKRIRQLLKGIRMLSVSDTRIIYGKRYKEMFILQYAIHPTSEKIRNEEDSLGFWCGDDWSIEMKIRKEYDMFILDSHNLIYDIVKQYLGIK